MSRILIVDDEDSILKSLKRVLRLWHEELHARNCRFQFTGGGAGSGQT